MTVWFLPHCTQLLDPRSANFVASLRSPYSCSCLAAGRPAAAGGGGSCSACRAGCGAAAGEPELAAAAGGCHMQGGAARECGMAARRARQQLAATRLCCCAAFSYRPLLCQAALAQPIADVKSFVTQACAPGNMRAGLASEVTGICSARRAQRHCICLFGVCTGAVIRG